MCRHVNQQPYIQHAHPDAMPAVHHVCRKLEITSNEAVVQLACISPHDVVAALRWASSKSSSSTWGAQPAAATTAIVE